MSEKGEEEPPEPKIILEAAAIQGGLSNLQRTPDGASYAFAYLNVEEKDPQVQELVNVNPGKTEGECAIEKFKYLRVVNLNKNAFGSVDRLKHLNYLYELHAAGNQIAEIDLLCQDNQTLKYLQKVDLTQNKLTKLPQIASPSITKLILDENEIGECSLKGHPALRFLSLNKNKLTSGEGLVGLLQLEELSIQENETLTSLKGLQDMPKLRKLNLTGSKLEVLADFPALPALEELILDGNAVADAK